MGQDKSNDHSCTTQDIKRAQDTRCNHKLIKHLKRAIIKRAIVASTLICSITIYTSLVIAFDHQILSLKMH